MTWFFVDDRLHQHRKALRAGAEAMGLWLMTGSWVADQLTDGFVPDYVARQHVDDLESVAARLVRVGLWVPGECDGDRGWWFHDYLKWNKSRQQVMDAREKDRQKKEKMRQALAAKRRGTGSSARPRGTPAGTPRGRPPARPDGSPALPDPGSPPSSGTPAAAREAPPGGPPASATPEGVAAARAIVDRKVPRHRRPPPNARPLLNTVRPDSIAALSSTPPVADARAEQDRLAELDAVQAGPDGTASRSPPEPTATVRPAEQHEQDSA